MRPRIALLLLVLPPPLIRAAPDQGGFAAAFHDRNQAQLGIDVTDHDVLELLYRHTDGDRWTVNTNWIESENHCDWFGISCTNIDLDGASPLERTRVERVELSGNNLSGSAPLSLLFRLPHLRVIKLDGNNIDYGDYASQEADLLSVGGLGGAFEAAAAAPASKLDASEFETNLQWIDLSHTDVGSTPATALMGEGRSVEGGVTGAVFRTGGGRRVSHPFLTDLYLTGVGIDGHFPLELTDLPRLERLVLDMNNIRGAMPGGFGNLSQLRYLSLRNNSIQGRISGSLGELRKLRHLILRGNLFTGTVPNDLTTGDTMPLLEHLDISRQRRDNVAGSPGLTGRLPSFQSMTNLRQLDLSFNGLSGNVPEDFLRDVNPLLFDYAFLGNNKLTGTVPSESIQYLPVDVVFLEDNLITNIDTRLCATARGGGVATFGCAAILCPPKTYGPGTGRQEDPGQPCAPCAGNEYWGGTRCNSFTNNGTPVKPTDRPSPEPTALTTMAEIDILLEFYAKTGAIGWQNDDGWRDAYNAKKESAERTRGVISDVEFNFCNWHGVECSANGDSATGDNTVEFLRLGSNNLVGKPPRELFHLRNMRTLALSDNAIMFDFDGIGEARSLQSLDLSNTGLYDLSGIEAVADTLTELYLEGNDLSEDEDGLPFEVFALTKLERLDLDACKLDGTISGDIEMLTNLISLSASNNHLTGNIPAELANLKALTSLRLRSNSLTGTIPLGLASLTELIVLDLSVQWSYDEFNDGGLDGPLWDFKDFHLLRRLDLSFNNFKGPVPENFLKSIAEDKPVGFEFADLSSNQLTGVVPEIIAKLNTVFLKDNEITGINPANCETIPFGCDAVMCPPGRFNSIGRQTSFDTPCQTCRVEDAAEFYGSIDCEDIGTPPEEPLTPSPLQSNDHDRVVLQQVYRACRGEFWTDSSGWMEVESSPCDWSGISCNAKEEVTSISLRSHNLVCEFPPEIFKISTLETLVLDGNDIDIKFDHIGNAKSLKILDLTHTGIDSVEGISAAMSLTDLFLTSNKFQSTFPEELFLLRNLETLSLGFNDMTGTIPAGIGSLTALQFLDLNENEFQGPLPVTFASLTNLEVLLLQSNNLSGILPQGLGLLPNIRFLDLSDQINPKDEDSRGGLTGQIPSFSAQKNIKRIDLSSNSFQMEIPFNFMLEVYPANFEFLDLSDNELVGVAPQALAKFPVDTIYLADNKITSIANDLCNPDLGGVIVDYGCNAVMCPPNTYNERGRQLTADTPCKPCPSAIFYGSTTCDAIKEETKAPTPSPTLTGQTAPPVTTMTQREILELIYDECGGPKWARNDNWKTALSICQWFGIRCGDQSRENVEAIMLSTNNLVGKPPPVLFQLPDLETLVLDTNNILMDFYGIGMATKLSSMDLSGTGTYSVDGISQAKSLKNLHLASNKFEGPIPSHLFGLNSLEELSLDFNSFTGLLPAEVGMLTNLKLLSIASNSLTGLLPLSLGALTKLVTLRLQNNHFSGTLPESLGHMKTLAFVDLSHQLPDLEGGPGGLSGALPSLSGMGGLRRINLSANAFIGTIPTSFLSGSGSFFEYADLSANHLSGEVPKEVGKFRLYLQDNFITNIFDYCEVMSSSDAVTMYGCDAILCPPNTFNQFGRQQSDGTACDSCSGAKYYGTQKCDGDYEKEIPILSSEIVAQSERKILEKLYNVCRGYHWNAFDNWNDDKKSICEWKGIKCKDGADTVEEINLGANNLHGTPPAEIFRLPNLRVLSLYSNPLTGIDFSEIERSTTIEELLLDATGIDSVDGIGKAKVLKKINARFNNLSGEFPSEIMFLSEMETLNIAHNHMSGTLPASLQNMKKLSTLILSGNGLRGELNDVVFPPSLRLLDLSKNEISGSIPPYFLAGTPETAEVVIDLSDNLIMGVVPKSLARFENIDLLLEGNFITDMDKELCQKTAWNDGDVGRYGCNGLLCPVGTFTPVGRQSKDAYYCKKCPNSPFLGASKCDGIAYSASSGMRQRQGDALGFVTFVTCFFPAMTYLLFSS